MTKAIIATGALDGKTIGVVWPDTPGLPETVQAGILDVLDTAGYEVAVAEQIGCGGATTCRGGNDIAVERMLEEGSNRCGYRVVFCRSCEFARVG